LELKPHEYFLSLRLRQKKEKKKKGITTNQAKWMVGLRDKKFDEKKYFE